MRVVAVYNIKGGVGKTAAAVNLAYLAAAGGARVLLWDLDPQAAATYYFRVKPKVKGGGRALISGRRDSGQAIRGTDYERLDLLPADFSYRNLDLDLDDTRKPRKRLRRLLKEHRDDYDLIFLDCAPSISLVSEGVFVAADALLVPTIPTTLSLRTLEQLAGHLSDQGPKKLAVMPFFSMVDSRKKLHREVQVQSASAPFELLTTAIPYASQVEQMGLRREPLLAYARHSRAALAFVELWMEVQQRMRRIGLLDRGQDTDSTPTASASRSER